MARLRAFDKEGKTIVDITTDDVLTVISKSFELAVALGCYRPSFESKKYECAQGTLEVSLD